MTERKGTILTGLGIAALATPMVAFALLLALPQFDLLCVVGASRRADANGVGPQGHVPPGEGRGAGS